MATTPVLSAHQVMLLLYQLGILLSLALCLGRLARRLGLPAVVGELSTGILLGPSVFARLAPGPHDWLLPSTADQAHLLDAVAQFAVLVLVGIAGAHLDLRMIRRRRAVVARVSLGGLLLPLALGLGAGLLAPAALLGPAANRTTFAVFLGVALCVSAIPVIAKTLADMKLLHRDIGQTTLAAASIEDAVGWFLLSLVSTMTLSGLQPGKVALSVLDLVGFVAAMVLVGRPLVRTAMRAAARSGEAGVPVATATVAIILGAAASQSLGLEAIFGAFLVGVVLGSSGPAQQRLLGPLRTVALSVLAPIFLATAGLRVDLGALRDPMVLGAGLIIVLLAVAGKLVGGYAGARLSKLTRWEGLALGAGLNARGVVEVVVASVGLRLGILSSAAYTIVVLVAVLTSVTAPPLLRLAMRRVEQSADESLREAEFAGWDQPGESAPATSAVTPAGDTDGHAR